jgi:TRAP-type transport system periplasmic protein
MLDEAFFRAAIRVPSISNMSRNVSLMGRDFCRFLRERLALKVPPHCSFTLTWSSTAAVGVLSASLMFGVAQAQDGSHGKPYVMKISIPTVGDATNQFAKRFAAAINRDAARRIKVEIYPAGQLGSIPRQIEGVQFGAIQCAIIAPEYFVGIDERFEVLSAPGLVGSMVQAQRLAADTAVRKLFLGLGAEKGLHGIALFTINPNSVIARMPIDHLAEFRGKKLRVFASQFQTVPFNRLGATSVAMALGDVLPALQQGTVDAALAGIPILAAMHFTDAAKYVTEIGQPMVFAVVELSKKWFDALPPDLQRIVERDAAEQSVAVNQWAIERYVAAEKELTDAGGVLIKLPPDEQPLLLKTLSAAAEDVAIHKPAVSAAYQIVKHAAERLQ